MIVHARISKSNGAQVACLLMQMEKTAVQGGWDGVVQLIGQGRISNLMQSKK